jgi:NADP-dependent 3-hydroxy acid dehydrogenase YdfG
LKACGASSAEIFVADLAAMDRIEEACTSLRARFGAIDEVVVAYGVLGEQAAAEQDLAQARALIDNNFTSAALWVLALLKGRAESTPLTFVGIGSVAGDKGRAGNFIYGSAKAAFDRFLEGLPAQI